MTSFVRTTTIFGRRGSVTGYIADECSSRRTSLDSFVGASETQQSRETVLLIVWLRARVRLQHFVPNLWTAEHDAVATRWLHSADASRLIAYITEGGAFALVDGTLPTAVRPLQFFYWLKVARTTVAAATALAAELPSVKLTLISIDGAVQYGAVTGGCVSSLARLVSTVMLPAVASGTQWPDGARSEFAGQLQVCDAIQHRRRAAILLTLNSGVRCCLRKSHVNITYFTASAPTCAAISRVSNGGRAPG